MGLLRFRFLRAIAGRRNGRCRRRRSAERFHERAEHRIDLERIEKQYDVRLGPRMEPLLSQGLIERDGARVRLAPRRLTVANEVFVALLD